MHRIPPQLFCIVLMAVFSAGVTGCGDVTPGRGQVIRVGVYQNPPKVFQEPDGEATGLFVEILDEIAHEEGWILTYTPCQWPACLVALQQGEIDLMPDVAYSSEREEQYDLHQIPIVESWSQLYRHPGTGIDSLSDVAGKRIATLRGSIQETTFRQMLESFGYDATLVVTESFQDAFRLAQTGSVDAAISNHFYGDTFYRDYGLEKSGIVFQPVSLYYATAEGAHADWLEAIDGHLSEWRSQADSPYYTALERWLDRPPKSFVPNYLLWVVATTLGLLALASGLVYLLRRQVKARTGHLAESEQRYRLLAQNLKDSEAKVRAIYQGLPIPTFVWSTRDAGFVLADCNAAALALTKGEAERWIGQPIETVHADGDELIGAVKRCFQQRSSLKIEITHQFSGRDTPRVLTVTCGIVPPDMVLVQIEDVTEQRQIEEQFRLSQRLEAIGQLAGGVAHDFNNLLTVISISAELAMENLDPQHPVREEIQEILATSSRASTLASQLLAFSRKQVLEPQLLDLNLLIRDAERMLRRLVSEDIEIKVILAESLGSVRADPGQLEQVLLNLVVNSRDAMPSGGKLTIETANVELDQGYAERHVGVESGPYVRLSVSDTGSGMDAQTCSLIFDPFFTTKEKGKGTGLGLCMAYGIVKQSGGHIWVYSEPGQGTTFKIYLPRVDLPATSDRVEPPAVTSTRHETVLVVEDDERMRVIAQRILRKAGYEVLSAANGAEALEICERPGAVVHLVLTDVVMPRMNGKQLADRLAETCPQTKVLFMSGYPDDAIFHHGVLDSGIHFISKPFSAAKLTRKIQELLDNPPDR
ncbi:MAG: transporter substrate-binding domain-containing protein [Bradymonadales bacterium]|nr:transporter substrate-binding domain-containing protein [Bradymonadales bacterium]